MLKKSQVYRRMAVSYILVAAVFAIVILVGFYFSYNVINKQALFYNEKLLETVKSVCDREVDAYYNTLRLMNYEEELRDYVSRGEYQSSEARMETKQVQNSLAVITDSMGEYGVYCKNLFIYLKEEDKVISADGRIDLETYVDIYFDMEENTDLRQVLQDEDQKTLIFGRRKNEGKYYALLFNYLVDSKMKRGAAVTGMWLDLAALSKKIDSVAWNKDVNWAMTDHNGRILICSQWLQENMPVSELNLLKDTMEYNGKKYMLRSADSDFFNWKFVLLTNSENMSDAITKMEWIYFVCALVMFVIAYAIVKGLLVLHYNPIRELVMTIADNGTENIQNEYNFIKKRVKGLQDMHKDVQYNLTKSNNTVKNYLLEEILTSSTIEKKELAICESVYNKFSEGENLVIICSIIEDKNIGKDEKQLNRYIVSNIYQEGFGTVFPIEVLEMESRVILILNLCGQDSDYMNTMETIDIELKEFLKEHYRFGVCTYIGNVHSGVKGIRKSYLEACETEEFADAIENCCICHKDIEELPLRSYEYSFGMEKRLYNAVKSGNRNLAKSYVEIVLKNNFKTETAINKELQTCLLYDVYGTLLKVAEEIGIKNGKMLSAGQVFADGNMQEIQAFFDDGIQALCAEVSSREEDSQWKKLCQNVLEYIHENYMDPNLDLARTAIHFKLTPSYLSAIYKKETGGNIPDTIREMRIEHSKVLLKEGYKIREVAEKLGFRDSSSFVRFFKNYTGMTPGQLKKDEL